MNRLYGPTELEFENGWQACYYVELLVRIMGQSFEETIEIERLEPEKDFDDEQQRYKLTFSRQVLKQIHDKVWTIAGRLRCKADLNKLIDETTAVCDKFGIVVEKSEKPVGRRVYALQCTEDNVVHFFGFGNYVGDEVPDSDAGGLASMVRQQGAANPKIILDNGEVVWGCECWWGPEKEFESKFGNHQIVQSHVSHFRAMTRGENN